MEQHTEKTPVEIIESVRVSESCFHPMSNMRTRVEGYQERGYSRWKRE